MTAHKFNKSRYDEMSMEGRTKHAWMYGNLIGSRSGRQISFYLYHVADFFVEMIFDSTKKKILNVYAFSDQKTLDKYLDKMNLHELVS